MTHPRVSQRRRTRLEQQVLQRIQNGLPPTPWQQARLHLQALWRQRRKPSLHRCAFHLGGVVRAGWRPVTIGRVANIPVQIHLTCLIYPGGLVALLDWSRLPVRSGLQLLLLVGLIGSSLLAHELGHALVARRLGIGARRIVFVPVGAFLDLEHSPRARAELLVAAAGPLVSLVLAGGCWLLLSALTGVDAPGASLARGFGRLGCAVNLGLGLFNLLPCFPMDGGRILRAGLTLVIGRLGWWDEAPAFVLATRIAVRYVAWAVALGMIALTLMVTQAWLHLILFPLVLLAAETEYWLLRAAGGGGEGGVHRAEPQPARSAPGN